MLVNVGLEQLESLRLARVPRHIGVIPDGNRRWAERHGLPRSAGYAAGVQPGLELLRWCRRIGVEELSAYGFTKENVRRPNEQLHCFREACIELGLGAVAEGAALLVVGDADSEVFPEELRPFTRERSPGNLKLNLLVNYGWQWDLHCAMSSRNGKGRASVASALGSAGVSRIELVLRWGGHCRLSGFLPMQTAYADMHVIDSLWPDMQISEFISALEWYQRQEVTMGG